MKIKTLGILLLVSSAIPSVASAATVSCDLKLQSTNLGGLCTSFKKVPFVPLFNQWNVNTGCDEVQIQVDLNRAQISLTPKLKGEKTGRTSTTQSRVFVVPAADKIIVNYNPGSSNSIAPMLMVLENNLRRGTLYWMHNDNGDSKFGPILMDCEAN